MTLLELYDKLCTGEIKLENGLCDAIYEHVSINTSSEFSAVMSWNPIANYMLPKFSDKSGVGSIYISTPGIMTPERETFLLLFAAYKGEL